MKTKVHRNTHTDRETERQTDRDTNKNLQFDNAECSVYMLYTSLLFQQLCKKKNTMETKEHTHTDRQTDWLSEKQTKDKNLDYAEFTVYIF